MDPMVAPLASCLMPTRDRYRHVARAIAYLQHQTYENRELVILDEGDDAIGDSRSPRSRRSHERRQ